MDTLWVDYKKRSTSGKLMAERSDDSKSWVGSRVLTKDYEGNSCQGIVSGLSVDLLYIDADWSTWCDRYKTAEKAYLSVFEGPWGLKASSEDALAAILAALYPDRFDQLNDRVLIKVIRNTSFLSKLADQLYEIEQEGGEADAVIKRFMPHLDRELNYA